MESNPRDNDPLHAPINARLAEIVAASTSPPSWYIDWIRLGPESSEEDRLAVYQAVRDSGCLPDDAGFYLVSWQLDAMASMEAEISLNHLDARMTALEEEHGLAEGQFWPPGKAPEEYERLRRQYQIAWDEIFAATLERYGEQEMARLFLADPEGFESRSKLGQAFFHGPQEPDDFDAPDWVYDLLEIVAGSMESLSGPNPVRGVVDYVRGEVTVQRRRGRMYVNDRLFDNLPELYRKLLPEVIEYFDGVQIPDDRALQEWLLSLRGRPRTFLVEGVILEWENGDEYAIPFFAFSEQDRAWLKQGWAEWLAAQHDYEQRDDLAFRLEAYAAAHRRNQKISHQIALMNLNLQAIQAGLTSAWEVTLRPVMGNPRPPRWVVVLGRDSREATVAALQQNL